MKKLSANIVISLISIIFYFFIFSGINSKPGTNKLNIGNKEGVTPPAPVSNNFINCIFNEAYEVWNHNAWILNYLDRYSDSLHFNSLQYYNYPLNSDDYGSFNSLMNQNQINNNKNLLTSVESKNLKTFTARQNVEKYCYGQRLIYEVSTGGSSSINDGFCYQNVLDSSLFIIDQGRTVLHAVPGQNDSGWLCQNIYENLQHTDLWDFTQADTLDWHLKPMMRIDTSIFSQSSTTPVISVVSFNYLGERVDSILIRVNNFRNDSNIYSGNYKNIFNFALNIDSLKTSGSPTNGLGKGRAVDYRLWKNNCKVDFKIYWYGLVEVWFDKLTVDDETADRIFNPATPQLKIDTLIKQESKELGSHEANLGFFVDEVVYSNIPCIKYVDSLLKSENPNSKMHTASTNQLNVRGLKDNDIGYRIYFQNVHLNSFNNDAHEISGGGMFIPSNFTNIDSRIPLTWIAANNIEYNNNLQGRVFGDRNSITPESDPLNQNDPACWGSLVYQVELARNHRDLYSPGTQFIMQPQIQAVLFKKSSETKFDSTKGLREPTNEEIQAQAMISIAHGAEGICWFIYPSIKESIGTTSALKGYLYNGLYNNSIPNTTFQYIYGLTQLINDDSTLIPRYSNMYGQDKWNYVKKMNIKIEHWKPILENIEWTSGWSVHSETATHEFIYDIKSLKRDPYNQYIEDSPCTNCDAQNERYWEMGFFDPDFENPSVSSNDKSKYFLMVNRRCVPDTPVSGQGDFRGLRIKFDSTKLAGFTNWKIIELDNNNVVATFNKNTTSYINMGEFKPGEGKLYKLAPVMQEGGTLVADESVNGIQFVCKEIVTNNGKNINIGSGTNISFQTGIGINMTGGNFICDGGSGSDYNKLIGYNGQNWNGINLTNTLSSTKIEKTTFENTKSPLVIYNSNFSSQYEQKIIRRNIFKVTQDSGTAVRINNQFALSLDSNTFDVSNYNSTSGIYLSNYSDEPGVAGYIPEDVYAVNITNNTFSGAYFPVLINDLGTVYSSFYMYKNQFVNTGLFGITGIKISGTIKNNKFTNPAGNYCIYLSLSNPDIYGNFFSSEKRNMILKSSYPNIAPIRNSNNQLIWKGGRNGFYINQNSDTTGKENIYFRSSLPLTDFGENDFSVPNSSSYHIFGSNSEQTSRNYLTRRNCWTGNNEIPKIFIYNPNDTPVIQIGFIFTPTSCIPSDNISNEVTNIGFDINDTTFISAFGSVDTISQDEAMYSEAVEMLSNDNYTEAGTNFKSLIDEFPLSDYIYSSEYSLYDSYCGLDTSSDQSVTDVLFGDLKQYLQAKISSGDYDDDFEDNAYYLILMCDNRMENYNSALSGYEFISLYNPDADRRIQASWEYDNIENLMNGSGGGEKDFGSQIVDFGLNSESFENEMKRRLTRINEFADNDPATSKIRQNYMKANNEKKVNKEQKENYSSKILNLVNIINSNENEEKLNERAKQNLYLSKRSSKEDKERRRFEDLKLILNPENIQLKAKESNNLIPLEYSLSQNYPNPFNPVTNLEFGISKLGFVTLKIYDLLGKEIASIVNENLNPGNYRYKFDGSNFASGVYFYKLVSGDFTAVKRMVLVK